MDIKEMDYESRIKCKALLGKVMSAEEAAEFVKPNMTLGCSGFTATGYPKLVTLAIAAKGTAKNLTVLSGASCGDEMDGALARAGLIGRRAPFNVNKDLKKGINDGTICYADQHLGDMSFQIRKGFWGKIDVAIVEVCSILENGGVVPTLSAGISPVVIEKADKVILELNLRHPAELQGMHDFYGVGEVPNENFLPITHPAERIGLDYIPCDPEKVAAIVVNCGEDSAPRLLPPDEVSSKIADNIIKVLRNEIKEGRLPQDGITFQSGFGAVANAVLYGLDTDEFKSFNMYSEIIADGAMEMVLSGKIKEASVSALSLSLAEREKFYDRLEELRGRVMIRPSEMSNNAALIRRMNIVAMNGALECDIYGNVNSTHVNGTAMMNGIGGSGDFARHAGLVIFMTPSVAKGGKISSIVPMVSHVDHTEHDVHMIITEHGVADLRGKSPKERAELIIENCADPSYRPMLRAYFEDAKQVSPGQHTPHNLAKALSWHQKFIETGSML